MREERNQTSTYGVCDYIRNLLKVHFNTIMLNKSCSSMETGPSGPSGLEEKDLNMPVSCIV